MTLAIPILSLLAILGLLAYFIPLNFTHEVFDLRAGNPGVYEVNE